MRIKNIKELKEQLNLIIKRTTKNIEEFKIRFNNNPINTLEWSNETFQASAEFNLATIYLISIEKNKDLTIENIVKYLEESILRGAKFPCHSTSPVSNLVNECKLVAQANLLSEISGRL